MTKDPRPLVVRNGLVVDGTGAPGRVADVAIRDGVITEVGRGLDATGADVIDADGLRRHARASSTSTPTSTARRRGTRCWPRRACTASRRWRWATAASGSPPPSRPPEQHDWLIGMLEGVEDIPGTALAEGLPWDWETFPDYLDALDRRHYAVDVGTHVVARPAAGLRDGRAWRRPERGADRRGAAGDGRAPCRTACAPAPSGSRRAAPSPTARATARRSAPGSRRRTSCWRSSGRWPRRAAASCR